MFVLAVYPRSRISDPGSILPLVVPNTTQLKFEPVEKEFKVLFTQKIGYTVGDKGSGKTHPGSRGKK
jgi:hypothetical protein